MRPAGIGRRQSMEALILLGFVLLTTALFLPAWAASTPSVIGGDGDAQQTMWFLAWTPWAITHGHNPFLTSHINSPGTVNLMWNSWSPVLAVLLWPVTRFAGLPAAYNAAMTLGVALSGYCGYRAAHRLVPHRAAAVCAGLVYGFCPYLMSQSLGHAKVVWQLLPPLLLILGHELFVRRAWAPWRVGLCLGGLMALQLLVYEETLALGLLGAAVAVAVAAVLNRNRVRALVRPATTAAACASATFAVVAAVPLGVQWLGPGRILGNVPGGDVYDIDIANLVVPTQTQLIAPGGSFAGSAAFSGNQTEAVGYVGVALFAVLVVVLWRGRSRPLVRWAGVTGVCLAVLSLGPQIHIAGHTSRLPLPWAVLLHMPAVGSAYPSRVFIDVDLLLAIAVALIVGGRSPAEHGASLRRIAPRCVAAVGVAAVAVTLVPSLPFPAVAVSTPAFFTGGDGGALDGDPVVLVAPFASDGASDSAMYWQASANMRFRMPEGYFVNIVDGRRADGPAPSSTQTVLRQIADGGTAPPEASPQLQSITRELRAWDVTRVVVGPTVNHAEMVVLFTRLFGSQGVERGGVTLWTL